MNENAAVAWSKWAVEFPRLFAFDVHFAWRPHLWERRLGAAFNAMKLPLRLVLFGTAALLRGWDRAGRPLIVVWPAPAAMSTSTYG